MSISNVKITPQDGALNVSWTITKPVGQAITVGWRKLNSGVTWLAAPQRRLASTATSCTLTGLDDGSTYEVLVQQATYTTGIVTQGTPVAPPPPPPPPPPTPTFLKGMTVNLQGWIGDIPTIAQELNGLGAPWARVDLSWADTETTQGTYDWSTFDKVASLAVQNKIQLLPVVGYAPSWTNVNNAQAYAAFVAAAVRRYGPGTATNCPWFELWNEPTEAYAWQGGTADPTAYAKLVQAAAQAAKQASSTVKVTVYAVYDDSPQVNGPDQWRTTWIDGMFNAVPNLGSLVDGVATHPYSGDPALPLADPVNGWKDVNGSWAFARVDQIRKKFLAHNVDLPMLITELGWSTFTVSPTVQATYYTHLGPAITSRPWIRALFPFTLREWGNNSNDQSQYGILTYPGFAPKPAYPALQATFGGLQ